ncbi:UNVERIFIED_CONTAM: hypothetical protein RF648_17615 [Kocuria sp. CPCC 205274]|uniref:Uncharacterized protein n=1 Tax=Herbiconiux daphne TaxID=2970914 RepID=A0ABT2H905_9MICO|nr:hypothetical protein [Herbiconiux daphne]MCS5736373.1 hypothetical protein [Herbiconiux daphne]
MNVIIIDQANTQLMSDLRKSFIAEGQTQRNEKGRFEKDYDFINSWEYALYFIRAIVHNVKPYEEFGTMEE